MLINKKCQTFLSEMYLSEPIFNVQSGMERSTRRRRPRGGSDGISQRYGK